MRFYDDLHILTERHEETQKPFHRELPKLPAQHLAPFFPRATKLFVTDSLYGVESSSAACG